MIESTIAGYHCLRCGTWVTPGAWHACRPFDRYDVPGTVYIPSDPALLQRIVDLERRVAELEADRKQRAALATPERTR